MGQRVGIASICERSCLMLMDEPFSHLDAQTRYMMVKNQRIWQRRRRLLFLLQTILRKLSI